MENLIQPENYTKIREWVESFKSTYFNSPQYHWYRNKTVRTIDLVNQRWGPNEQSTRNGLKLGLMRGAFDSQYDNYEQAFDIKNGEWIVASPRHQNAQTREEATQLEYYGNNLLESIDYTSHILQRCLYIPTYGWSVAFSEYRFNEGNVIKPISGVETRPEGGLIWEKQMDSILDGVVNYVVSPLNWFGDPNKSIHDQWNQGFIRRWTAKDFYSAKAKMAKTTKKEKNEAGEEVEVQVESPLYNPAAIEHALKELKANQTNEDSNFQSNYNNTENDKTQPTSPFMDVVYYIGTLDGVKGQYADPNTYVVEMVGDFVLRVTEHPIDKNRAHPISHMQTNPKENEPFPRTGLDATVPHARINDTLVNVGLENVLISNTRTMIVNEDDWRNPQILSNPKGVMNILFSRSAKPPQMIPKIIDDNRSGSMVDLLEYVKLLDRDRQRVGASDQELGVQGGTADKTATAARILAGSQGKASLGRIKRMVRTGILPQINYILLLSLQNSTPEEKFLYGEDATEVLTENLFATFLEKAKVSINDSVTTDRNIEAVEYLEFYNAALQYTNTLGAPEFGIMALRNLGLSKGIPKDLLDGMFPAPQLPQEIVTEEVPESGAPAASGGFLDQLAASGQPPQQPQTQPGEEVAQV